MAKGGGSVATGTTHGAPRRWVPGRPPAAGVGLSHWRSRNRGVLRHPQTLVPLRKSQPKVLGGWESPWPCTDLPSPGSSPGTGSGCGGDRRAAPTTALLGSPVLSPCEVGFAGGGGSVSPPCCWDARGGGSGLCSASSQSRWLAALGALVLYPFPSAVQDLSPQRGVCIGAVGDPGDAQGRGGGEPCCLPPLIPSLHCISVLSEWGGEVRFLRSGSDPPCGAAATSSWSPHFMATSPPLQGSPVP